MHILLLLFLILSVFYLLVVILVELSFFRLKSMPWKGGEASTVSIVIAAKNESGRLQPILKSLQQLDYPPDKFEVIFVDDASTDDTPHILDQAAAGQANWKVLRRTEQSDKFHAKKMALAEGIDAAKGDIIFTTDADCRVPQSWLKSMTVHFDRQTDMVLGFSPLENIGGFMDKWLKFDNLFSAIVVAAPTVWGFPISSVGRNMAFRKTAYDNIGGYRALTKFKSGDDIHLTERMRDRSKGKIKYCADAGSFVYTQPPATTREIFYQQIRKNSKILDKSLKSAAFSVALFAAFLLFYTLPLFDARWLNIWLIITAVRLSLEFITLTHAAVIFKTQQIIPLFPLIQIIYPVYVMILGGIGWLHLYDWK